MMNMMKKLLVILLVSPILLFSTELYENAYMWTQNQGFYKQYRLVAAMAKNVDGKVVIWTEEKELPTMFMLPDYSKNALWTYVGYGTLDSTHVNTGYTRDMATGSYTQNSLHLLMMGKDLYNVYIQNIHGTSQSKILVATSGGVFWTTNDGSSWLPVAQNGFLEKDVMAVTASPANVTSFLPFRSKVYAIGYDGNVHNKTMMTSGTWTKLEGVGKTLYDFENSGDLTTLPSAWERVNDDGSHVLRDSTIFEDGNYSLVIKSNNESGDYGASDTLIPSYTRWLVDFSFYMDTVSGVSSFSGGRFLVRNNGYAFEIEFKSDGVYLAGTDTKLDTVVLSSWNHYYLHLDFVDGKARLYGPDAKGKEVILDSTTEASCIMFLGPSEPGYTYYIDNFQIGPELFALMHHPSNMNQAFVSAADGIYMRVDSLSKWEKKFSYVGYPARLASDIWGKYYAFIDPEAHKVFFSADSGETWQNVTDAAFDSITLYSVAIDTAGNLYVGTSYYLYCLKSGSSTWEHYTNGFTQYGLADMVSQVLSVVPFTPETIFVGNYNGIYASFNGGATWVEDNDAVVDPSEPYLTPENIAELDSIMEGDSAHVGLYTLVEHSIGKYPDVDRDGQIHVLLLDIFDEDATGTTGWNPGYYDFTNEYINDSAHVYSNHKDMIYVDYELFVNDQSKTVHNMLDNLVEMVSMWADQDEEGWMKAGFKGYARYLYDVGTDSTDVDSGTYTVTWQDAGTGLIGITEDYYGNIPTYWFMYLRELYGESGIKDIIKLKGYKLVDQMTGRRDSILLQGIEALDTLLIRKGSNFDDTYADFVDRILGGNLKYYPNLGVICSSYPRIMNHLSTLNYYAVTGCLLDSAYVAQFPGRTSVNFNGSNKNDFLLFTVIYASTGDSVNLIKPGDGNKYVIDVSDLYDGEIDSMKIFVMSTSDKGTDPSKAYYYLTNNTAKDTTRFSVIVQSPISERYCRFYTFSTAKLYTDIGDERPYLKLGSNKYYMEKLGETRNGQNYYMTDFTIPRGVGTEGIDMTLNAEDGAGNVYEDTFHIEVHNVTSEGATFAAAGYEIVVPENALDGRLTTIASKKSVFLGFNSICGEITLRAPAAENMVFALVESDGGIHAMPTERCGHYLVTKVTSPGTYMLVKGEDANTLQLTYGIEKVSPNPFSNNQIVQFSIPVDTRLTLSVVDVSGRIIKTLMNGEYRAGSYSVVWDGTNGAGKKVSSGIYFVLLNSKLGKISHKTVYVR